MHLNVVNVIGRIGKSGPKLQYASNGNPTCTVTLEVDELGKGGDVFTLYLPVEIWGHAESAAEVLEPGDEVMLSGRLKYRSTIDPKSQVKVSKLIISTWGIQQRQPGEVPKLSSEYNSGSDEGKINTGPSGAPEPVPGIKARRRAIPKHLQKPWVASRLEESAN